MGCSGSKSADEVVNSKPTKEIQEQETISAITAAVDSKPAEEKLASGPKDIVKSEKTLSPKPLKSAAKSGSSAVQKHVASGALPSVSTPEWADELSDSQVSTWLEAVQAALTGRDCCVFLPTGAGKSLCFQLPALLQEGVVLVISPLIALMQDQVAALLRRSVRARSLTSAQVE